MKKQPAFFLIFLCLAIGMSIFGAQSIDTEKTITKVLIANYSGDNYIVASSYEGTVMGVNYDGSIRWTNELSGFMNHDIFVRDITGDGKDEIFAANADGSIYCLNSDGSLKWAFKENGAPMMSGSVLKDGNTMYIVVGGMDKRIYYLNTNGGKVKTIETSTFANESPWGDGELPPKNINTTNFIRTVKKSDGTEILAYQGTQNHMQARGDLYLFNPLDNMPYKEQSISLISKTVGDLRAVDPDGDGNDELLFGGSGFRFTMGGSKYNVASASYTQHDVPTLDFGYRVAVNGYIPSGSSYQYLLMYGNQMDILSSSYVKESSITANYSFYDMVMDYENTKIVFASSQSGGSCINIIDYTDSDWQNQYKNLSPGGSLQKLLSNTTSYRNQLTSFSRPSHERQPVPVYFMSESIDGNSTAAQVGQNIVSNYDSPLFLGNNWGFHCENWDRSGVAVEEYRNRRDDRMTYDWSSSQVLDFYKDNYSESGIAQWGGHGNDPYFYSLPTLKSILDYGSSQNKQTVFIFPELEDHTSDFEYVLDNHIYPLADYAKNKNGKVFVRSKNIFWLSVAHLDMWDELASGEYADVFIPSMEETTDKTMELSLASRMGLWASGSVNSWGGRSVPDNVTMLRNRQFAHQRVPNHALRQMVYAISSGCQYLDNLTADSDYMSFLWELIAKGALYVPERDELLSISPVHLSMVTPTEEFILEGTNVKWTTFYDEDYDENHPRVFSRMKGHWPGAELREWDFSSYAAGVKDRHYHFVPPYNNGMVLITPAQEGAYADASAPRGKLADNLHPIYKNIMSEYYTDGEKYYSADGTQSYNADTYYTTIKNDIESKASLLPITVTGEAGWVVAQTDDTHLRLTLIDGGYLNPSDKTVMVRFNNITPVSMKDVLDGTNYTVNGSSVQVDIPCGLFRFIDVELDRPLGEEVSINDLKTIDGPTEITKGWIGEVAVDYAAAEEMDVKFQLVLKEPWTTILTVSNTVAVGSGTTTAQLTVPTDAAAGDYVWMAWMTPKGSNWDNKVDQITVDVTVTDEKRFADFLMPMTPLTPLVNTGTWGVNGGIWGDANVSPRDTSNGLEDATTKNYCYWDGKILKGDDGKFHMYASRWGQDYPHSTGWKEDSKAIHAVSDNIVGPYVDKGLCYPNWNNDNPEWQLGRGSNVVALRMHDGRYAVVSSEITPGNVFVSDSPDGPFEHLGQIEFDCNGFSCGLARYNFEPNHMSNVKMMLRPDGKYMIIPRTTAPMLSENGILGPYKIMGNAVYNGDTDIPQEYNEDPAFWYSNGLYHIMFNHWPTATMYHYTSEDGINNWEYRGIAIDKSVDKLFKYTDGTINSWPIVERPTAYVDETTGFVSHFMFSVLDTDSKGGDAANDNHASKIVIVPFDGEGFDCYVKNKIRAAEGLPMQECSAAEIIDVTGVNLSVNAETLEVGQTLNLTATVQPTNASNKIISWESSNTTVATVSGGLVTAKQAGTAIITVATQDGNKQATCTITVKAAGDNNYELSPIYDAYLQGSTAFNSGDLRVEAGNRVSYLMFDLSTISDEIVAASLELSVGSDAGSGEVTVSLGSGSNWTETTLSTANAPVVGTLLGSLNESYAKSLTYAWDLDVTDLESGDLLSLVITHVSGNDISFASKEYNGVPSPKLKLTTRAEVIVVNPETMVIEAESYEATGGTIDDAVYNQEGISGEGFKNNGSEANWVNNGDWAEYTIEVVATAEYNITYLIASPNDGTQIKLLVDGSLVATDVVPNTEGWEVYEDLVSATTVTLTAGTHTIRLEPGTDTWNWNIDKITLSPVDGMPTSNKGDRVLPVINIYPNPAKDIINVAGLEEEAILHIYNMQGVEVIQSQLAGGVTEMVPVSMLTSGLYAILVEMPKSQQSKKLILSIK